MMICCLRPTAPGRWAAATSLGPRPLQFSNERTGTELFVPRCSPTLSTSLDLPRKRFRAGGYRGTNVPDNMSPLHLDSYVLPAII